MRALPRMPALALRRAAIALAAIAGLACLLPSAALAAPTELRGAQVHPLWWSSSVADFDRELDLVKDAGANTVRMDISWSSLETDGKGQFSSWYVNKADTFIAHAEQRGLKVIATFWSTPCWASSAPDALKQSCTGSWWDRGVDRYAPRDAAEYAEAAAWVARRWGSKLAALEIWNEPNLPDKYSLQAPDPAVAYADILKTAYPRVKAAAPGLTVLGGALAFSDGEFLKRLYDLGIKGNFDGLSVHPYNEWRDPDDAWKPEWRKYTFLTGVPWMHDILVSHGDGDKSLWLTEFGFSTCGQGSSWCVSEAQQAEYVKDSFRIAAGWTYVKSAIVYNLRNKGSVPDDREDQFGLVRRDFTPKPGYHGFKEAMAAAGGGAPPPGRVDVELTGASQVTVTCTATSGPGCTGSVRQRTKRKVRARRSRRGTRRRVTLVTRRFSLAPGERRVVRLPLSPSKRRLVQRAGRLRVTNEARARDHRGQVTVARRSFTLRARGR